MRESKTKRYDTVKSVIKSLAAHAGNGLQQSATTIKNTKKTASCNLVQEAANGIMTPTGLQPIIVNHCVI